MLKEVSLFSASMTIAFVLLQASAAVAAELEVSNQPLGQELRTEIRAGVLYHDLMGREDGVDLNAEILLRWAAIDFRVPGLAVYGYLRPHFGGSLNTAGDTSAVYAGYSLTLGVTDRLFVEGGLGAMVHNGNMNTPQNGKLTLGETVLFRETASIGFRITDHANVSAMIAHSSNAGLSRYNNGLTNVGVRLGYSF